MVYRIIQTQRLYTTTVWVVVILLVAGVISLLLAIVRDHKD